MVLMAWRYVESSAGMLVTVMFACWVLVGTAVVVMLFSVEVLMPNPWAMKPPSPTACDELLEIEAVSTTASKGTS